MKKLHKWLSLYSNHNITLTVAIIFCLTQLSGCGIISGGGNRQLTSYDGPPKVDIEVSKIKDAIPKVEPLHPYGTKNYVVGGRRYRVLKSAKGYAKKGYASWYGSKFHGNQTSTQERFNLYAMTAASPELPLPSYVQVTNLRNGKKVVVRVNDRGPFYSNRILDLSYAAAKKLDFVAEGVTPVKIVAIDPKTWGNKIAAPTKKQSIAQADHTASFKPSNGSPTFLQVGAFVKLDNAKELLHRINQLIDKPAQIKHKADLYRVQIGPIANSTQSDNLKHLLEQNGFNQVAVVEG